MRSQHRRLALRVADQSSPRPCSAVIGTVPVYCRSWRPTPVGDKFSLLSVTAHLYRAVQIQATGRRKNRPLRRSLAQNVCN